MSRRHSLINIQSAHCPTIYPIQYDDDDAREHEHDDAVAVAVAAAVALCVDKWKKNAKFLDFQQRKAPRIDVVIDAHIPFAATWDTQPMPLAIDIANIC